MAPEKFANLAETTLAASYTSGGTSITVASATDFPSTGVFRVALGNTAKTIFRVDSAAGAIFTGSAEYNDGNAAIGDVATQVGSRAVAERFLQSPDSGEERAPSGVSAADFYGPLHKLTALDQSGWTWDNQDTKSVSQAGGIVFLAGPATGAGTSVGVRYTASPVAPYVITAAIQPLQAGDNGVTASAALMFGGIGWRAAAGNLRLIVAAANGGIYLYQYNGPTSFDLLLVARLPGYSGGPVWFRLDDDAFTHIVSYSLDGRNFTVVRSSVAGEFTIQDVCIAVSTEGALADFPFDGPYGVSGMSVLSWLEA